MKISYNWLKEYCNVNFPADKVSKMLTDCGLEVEHVETFESIKGGLEGIVIGDVKTRIQHPNADRLSVTTVDIGTGTDVQIVCGAPNVAAGQKVVVATVGATLYPSTGEPFKINKSKIRGEVSEGMICAEDEIGLGESHAGIMVLENNAKTGTPAADYFKIENDKVFEIGLTPNRVDASSHIGVARDLIAVVNTQKNGSLSLNIPSVNNLKTGKVEKKIKVSVEDKEGSPRYSGVVISNVTVKPSPDWLQNRLKSIGLKPLNNIVDITNYVLHECGQPLHAFDAEQIKGDKVIVKRAKAGSKFTTLEGTERELSGEDLMICNAEEPMCIAGVYGGLESGVKESTKTIFLESAYFDPGSIRKSSKRFNLKTDAAFRFERGVDPNNTIYALKRAAQLIQELAGGIISDEIIDIYPSPIEDFKVELSFKHAERLIGYDIGIPTIKEIVKNLGMKIKEENSEGLVLTVPSFKVDVKREADVIEEILRIFGYNNIPLTGRINASLNSKLNPDKEKIQHVISDYLSNNGFNEIMSLSLTNPELTNSVSDLKAEENVYLLNPLSKELEALRQTLLFSGLESITYNKNRRQADLKLYEFGKTYHKTETKYREENHFALFVTGKKLDIQWNSAKQETDVFHLKGFVENILQRTGLKGEKFKYQVEEISENGILSQGLAININKRRVCILGPVKKQHIKTMDVNQEVYYADFNFDQMIELIKSATIKYKEVAKYPEVRRDLSMVLDRKVKFSEIEQLAFNTERNILTDISLFDVYEGEKIAPGKKSYAVSFTLLDENETLTDKKVEKTMERIMQGLEKTLGAEIRK